jgi:thiol-disulfide isomerase/thioredoxin
MNRITSIALCIVSVWTGLFAWSAHAGATSKAPVLASEVVRMLAARPALRGAALSGSDLHGRAVVVSFFASWCPPCHIEFKHLAELRREFPKKDLTIVAINHFESFAGFDDGGARLERFLDRHEPGHFVIRGNDEIAGRFGGITRIPTVFVFDRKGDPVFHFIHRTDSKKTNPSYDELRRAIETALTAGGA